MIYVDSLSPLDAKVGFGTLGIGGSLGYEGKKVSVQRRGFNHALSTHPPARVQFRLDRPYSTFSSHVALNDDVPAGASHADFAVIANGREVAVESFVRAGEPPRALIADISGVENLELVVRTSRWEYCHAVWLDPHVGDSPPPVSRVCDCMGRAEIHLPDDLPQAERCIATVVSPKFESMLDDMLGSLCANGFCGDALLMVFVLDGSDSCELVARKYGARVAHCQSRAPLNPMSKALLYSVARAVPAQWFLCLDADMLVLDDLRPVFSMLEGCPEGKIVACREGNSHQSNHLGHSLKAIYGGTEADMASLRITPQEQNYSLVVNDGLFAGGRSALLALDGVIRAMPQAASWADGNPRVSWRNQFIFNLALARLECGIELDSTYNVQLHVQDVEFQENGARLSAMWRGRKARVLHFSGGAKHKYPTWRNRYAGIPDPLVTPNTGDSFGAFLQALRIWLGKYGITGLAWSVYGLTDAHGASVKDASVLPLLAALHYLVRSNGCVRILETGTARGISAACFASAVAHRGAGRVVTLDPYQHPGREDLWATLPTAFRACIEARQIDSLAGMQLAIASGEHFEAALLDSIHTEEHVWAEFQLAAQLVCPGGLILVHDAIYAGGTVEGALRRIEASGYNVVRLWTAEAGVSEDDHLGLAVIENRKRRKTASQPGEPAHNG